MTNPIIEIDNLTLEFDSENGRVAVLNGVTYSVARGEVLAVVGESGSGKSVTALSILGLNGSGAHIVAGSIRLEGKDLIKSDERSMRAIRGNEIAMIFQDPMTTLNPVITIGKQLVEAIRIHKTITRRAARERVVDLLQLVGIPNPRERFGQYPHEFSGGMRQRVVIAMALANHPRVLIADEPTTALDVTIQAQILNVIRRAQAESDSAVIFITHDLGVVAEIAQRVAVMYAGRIVEQGSVDDVFRLPLHPYTAGLLDSIPNLQGPIDELAAIPGAPPQPGQEPEGCAFAPRCGRATSFCHLTRPELREIVPNRWSACHFAEELNNERNAERAQVNQ